MSRLSHEVFVVAFSVVWLVILIAFARQSRSRVCVDSQLLDNRVHPVVLGCELHEEGPSCRAFIGQRVDSDFLILRHCIH